MKAKADNNKVFCIMEGQDVCSVVREEDVSQAIDAWSDIYKDLKVVPIKDVIDTSKTIERQAQQLFGRMRCPYEIWEEDGKIRIEIEWGDWKHDHGNADFVMETAFGFDDVEETVTEEDGSDCYSSIHTYARKKRT